MATRKTKTAEPKWPASSVEMRPIGELLAYPQNPMIHSDDQVQKIAASIKEYGWTTPALVDEAGILICGHARVRAAQVLGITQVPVMVARGWTEAQKKAYRIADNQLPRLSEFNPELLRIELNDLKLADYPLELIGFDNIQLVQFMAGVPEGKDPEAAPEPPATPVSKRGDIWVLGQHRLMCGDALSAEDVEALLAGAKPDLANCDPPYGVSIVKSALDGQRNNGRGTVGASKPFGSVGGAPRASDPKHIGNYRGRVHGLGKAGFGRVHGNAAKAIIPTGVYAEIIGDDTTETAIAGYQMLLSIGVPLMVLWGGNYYANALSPSRCWFVWDKQVTGTFADIEMAWTNCDQVARLFHHQWNGLMKDSERGERRVHPTQKPVALAEWVIETAAPKAKSTVDLFLGSGSSLIAAERKGLKHFGMEMAEAYVDATLLRWQNLTNKEAHLEAPGKPTYAAVKAERSKPARKPKRAPRATASA